METTDIILLLGAFGSLATAIGIFLKSRAQAHKDDADANAVMAASDLKAAVLTNQIANELREELKNVKNTLNEAEKKIDALECKLNQYDVVVAHIKTQSRACIKAIRTALRNRSSALAVAMKSSPDGIIQPDIIMQIDADTEKEVNSILDDFEALIDKIITEGSMKHDDGKQVD